MATFPTSATDESIARLAQDAACARGISWIDGHGGWVTDQQIRLTEIPAPEFGENKRAELLRSIFGEIGMKARVDETGNVVAERVGMHTDRVVLLAAHLDTVFPAGTDVRVRREGKRLLAPGISDNGAGLAALAGVARAFVESSVRTDATIVFAGDVGEEGEGNLRGIRVLVDAYGSRLAAVIAIDGPSISHITTQGVASRRLGFSIGGPGGHSWSDFGAPNPITAISRGIVQFSSIRVSETPRSTFNFGVIEGGNSVNSIPAEASVKVDLRSESEAELSRMESALRDAMQGGMNAEISSRRAGSDSLKMKVTSLGSRPAGKLADTSPLLQTIRDVDRYLQNSSRVESSSTDANLPLSMKIPAVSLGGGGKGGGAHTLAEWYDPTARETGIKRLFLAALALAGLQQ
ncbi:MAG TPA: M20/M25/M40 family metallo-hydrolase [Candidatus Acidoferrum sp.]|jgi:tripeptide aminopeptidase|nr:M20/M25/M40 family metallo-hydrolase [Candidatus Acidoferrum sp.]